MTFKDVQEYWDKINTEKKMLQEEQRKKMIEDLSSYYGAYFKGESEMISSSGATNSAYLPAYDGTLTLAQPVAPPVIFKDQTKILNSVLKRYSSAEDLVGDELFHGAWPNSVALGRKFVDLGEDGRVVEVYDDEGGVLPECHQCGGRTRTVKSYIRVCGSCDAEDTRSEA